MLILILYIITTVYKRCGPKFNVYAKSLYITIRILIFYRFTDQSTHTHTHTYLTRLQKPNEWLHFALQEVPI